jgi:hypothetical protein
MPHKTDPLSIYASCGEFAVPPRTWIFMLSLAEIYGWEPRGTAPPDEAAIEAGLFRYLRTLNGHRPHRHIRFEMPTDAASEWRESLIAALKSHSSKAPAARVLAGQSGRAVRFRCGS